MRPGSEESNVAALPCFFQVPKQQAPQPAANRGVAVPAGKLKAATAGVGCPGAVGNMHVLGDIGNVVHATARSSTGKKINARIECPSCFSFFHSLSILRPELNLVLFAATARSSYRPGMDQSSNHQEVQRSTLEEGPGRSIQEWRRTDSKFLQQRGQP
ncbi:uncharacterized protein [Triticum aestivum]|uniref:uncharacterized protein n=1 Tax=Triticum aestivum TaxID=4565 RepID=UPI001D012401|nr:uncharacterized protein LOC123110978 [Triticum aestivum]